MKKFMVIAYDIENNKQRRQAHMLLKAVGRPVNKSVFECFITDNMLEKLKRALTKRVTRYDAVLYYPLCRACLEKVERHGVTGLPVDIVRMF